MFAPNTPVTATAAEKLLPLETPSPRTGFSECGKCCTVRVNKISIYPLSWLRRVNRNCLRAKLSYPSGPLRCRNESWRVEKKTCRSPPPRAFECELLIQASQSIRASQHSNSREIDANMEARLFESDHTRNSPPKWPTAHQQAK